MVDGADEIDPDLNAIKGRRGCFFQEKFVAQASRKYVLIAGNNNNKKNVVNYAIFIFVSDNYTLFRRQ